MAEHYYKGIITFIWYTRVKLTLVINIMKQLRIIPCICKLEIVFKSSTSF